MAHSEPLSPQLRRRNRRLAWIIAFFAIASAAWTPYAVHHGWIYPEETTFAFPHWGHK
ncbi:MAG: hypothetical protein ACRD2D_02545 [Terriglobales bacterium]